MKPKVYIETSVWSFAFADDVPDYRRDTLAFFERCRASAYTTHISAVVLEEIEAADEETRSQLTSLVTEIAPELLEVNEAAEHLTSAFLNARVVPPGKPEDAEHVAVALAHGLDVLVSWNFRHIVSLRRADKFNAVAILEGYYHPLKIITPAELMYDDQDYQK